MRSFVSKKYKKWILAIFVLVILGLGASYLFLKYRASTQPSIELQKSAEEMKIKDIHNKQKTILDFYTSYPFERNTKAKIFYELMGPLGGLDPIAKPTEVKDIHATVNFLFGFYYKIFGFPDPPGYAVTAPVRYEYDFDEVAFFNKNKTTFELLANSLENDNRLWILSWGYSTNYRINEYFGDDIREFYWKISMDDSPFYSYEMIKPNSNEYQTLLSLKENANNLITEMAKLKIQSVYKCKNKIITLVDGLSDNAFGYIYNAQSGADVNCGILQNRFRIYKDIVMDEKWRFWFAK